MERGESKDIRLYLNGKTYSARLKNNRIAAKFGAHTDIVQVRYEKNSELSKLSSYIKQRIIINRIHFTLQEEEIHN